MKTYIILSCALSLLATAATEAQITPGSLGDVLAKSDKITIQFFNTAQERRSDFDVPELKDENVTYSVNILCKNTSCNNYIHAISSALENTQESRALCNIPVYARMVAFKGDAEIARVKIDRGGHCLTSSGRSFYSRRSVTDILMTLPIPEW
jgi:hypothetical protein